MPEVCRQIFRTVEHIHDINAFVDGSFSFLLFSIIHEKSQSRVVSPSSPLIGIYTQNMVLKHQTSMDKVNITSTKLWWSPISNYYLDGPWTGTRDHYGWIQSRKPRSEHFKPLNKKYRIPVRYCTEYFKQYHTRWKKQYYSTAMLWVKLMLWTGIRLMPIRIRLSSDAEPDPTEFYTCSKLMNFLSCYWEQS